MSTYVVEAFHTRLPPRVGPSAQQVLSVATGLAAVSSAVFTPLAAADRPSGKVMVTFEAVGFGVYIRLGTTVTTGTTAANGLGINAGEKVTLWLSTERDVFVDVLALGVGTLKWYVASPEYDNVLMHGTV
jgi:hypothetical protein